MSASVADDMIRSYFERWQRLEDEKRTISDDLKELFAEARGNGLDTKALRAVFREQVGDKAALQEFDALCDLYRASLNAPRAGRARESQSYAEAKGVEPRGFIASLSDEQKTAALAYRGDETHGGELTDTQEQPEEPATTSNPVANVGEGANGAIAAASVDPASRDADGADRQQPAVSGLTGGDDGRDVEAFGGAAPVITNSNPQPTSSPAIADSPASTSSPEPGSLSEDGFDPSKLTFLTQGETMRKTAADYRGDDCQHPDGCGSTDPFGLCYTCRKAMEAASETEAA